MWLCSNKKIKILLTITDKNDNIVLEIDDED